MEEEPFTFKMVIFSIVIAYVLLIPYEKKLCLNLMLPLMRDIEAFKQH